jgi:hypothetical protein
LRIDVDLLASADAHLRRFDTLPVHAHPAFGDVPLRLAA